MDLFSGNSRCVFAANPGLYPEIFGAKPVHGCGNPSCSFAARTDMAEAPAVRARAINGYLTSKPFQYRRRLF
jgi:hypothetical protein